MEKSDLPERPDHCSIILVHGTWGRGIFPHTPRSGERWFDANSSFCAGLKRSLDLRGLAYDIESFEWSGANSFIERYRAASALAERLQNKHAPPFDSRIVCIAHSHGGNVVMKAVEILGKDCPPTEIITLAIPFFRVESLYNKPISIGFEFNWWWISLLICAVDLSAHYFVSHPISESAENILNGMTEIFATPLIGQLLLFPIVMLLLLIILIFYRFFIKGVSFDKRYSNMNFVEAANTERIPENCSLLVIRDIDDEATFALIAGRMGARLNAITLAFVGSPFGSGVFAVILLASVIFLAAKYPPADRTLSIGVSVILLGIPVLSAIFRSTAGREFLIAGAGYDLAVNSAPDTLSVRAPIIIWRDPPKIVLMTLGSERETGMLRHSLYNLASCTEVMTKWLSRYPTKTAP